jgi:pilus assembly protein Flp/PilA
VLLSLYLGIQDHFVKLRNDRGASAVEYGLLVALIAVVIIGAVTLLGGNLNSLFEEIAELLPG